MPQLSRGPQPRNEVVGVGSLREGQLGAEVEFTTQSLTAHGNLALPVTLEPWLSLPFDVFADGFEAGDLTAWSAETRQISTLWVVQ